MSVQVQTRRGNTAQHSAFTGAPGEITVNTDKNVVVVHDGMTIGGHELAGTDAFDRANQAYALANVIFDSANTDYNTSNLAFDKANAAYEVTNVAFGWANTIGDIANAAYDQANVDYAAINSAFTTINANYTSSNAAYETINSAYEMANAGYGVANAAYDQINVSTVSSNSYADFVGMSGNSYTDAIAFATNTRIASVAVSANNYADQTFFRRDGGTISGPVLFQNTIYLGADAKVNGSIDVANSVNAKSFSTNTYIDYLPLAYNTPLVPYKEGRLWYNNDAQTLQLDSDNSDFPITMGEREWVRCRNNSGAPILKGQPVYVTGVHMSGHPIHGHHPTIALADASDVTKKDVLGLAGHDIADGTHGYVVCRGYIANVNTSMLVTGTRIHLGWAEPGTLIQVAPEYPNYPMDVGFCLTSDPTVGTLYVSIFDHSVESFRVEQGARVGGNFTVEGDFTVLGTQTITRTDSLSLGTQYIYLSAGDSIPNSNISFSGSGLNDMTFRGHYEGVDLTTFYVKITEANASGDYFSWSYDNFATVEASNTLVLYEHNELLSNGISVFFQANTGHDIGDTWNASATSAATDAGFVTNHTQLGRYTHAGMFRDATDGTFKFFNSYDIEPQGNIDIDDPSFALGNVQVEKITAGEIYSGFDDIGNMARQNQTRSIAAFGWANDAHAWANTVGTSGNSYTNYVGASANSLAVAIGVSGNSYADYVGASANANALSIATAMDTSVNSFVVSVGTAGNNYTNYVGTSANAYALSIATAMDASVNAYVVSVGAAANAYALSTATAMDASVNSYVAAVGTAGNNYTNRVGSSANAYASATYVTAVSGTSGRVTSSGGLTPTIDLATAGAGAASYSSGISALTVDAYGRLTSVTGSAGYITNSISTNFTTTGRFIGGALQFDSYGNWNGGSAGGAAICNDNSSYQTLMIVGNNSGGGNRRVKVWDDFYVNGSIVSPVISGTVNIQAAIANYSLTDGANIAWDLNSGQVATVTLGGDRTMNAPSNLRVGTFILHVYQDGTGSRTLTWNSIFKWPAGVAPVLTTTANRHDIFSFICDGTNLYGSYLPDVR